MDPGSNAQPVRGTTGLNAFLWFVQSFLTVQYLFHGWLFISPPAAMVEAMAGMGLHVWFRQFIGVAEVLAAVGLVLPGLTRMLPSLTPLSALGLTVVMISATIFHISRNEIPSAVSAANLLVLVALTAYLRWNVLPIRSRAAHH